MKLLLTSAGFSTSAIFQACVELCGKPEEEISFAIINEAYAVETGGMRWVLDDLNRIADNFPGEVDLVNLLALDYDQVRQRIESKDVIFVVGGHTDYLMSVFNKTGFVHLLPELLEKKVYVGSSAGSMMLTKRVSTEAYQRVYNENGTYDVTEYMGLVDFAMKPHLDSPLFPNNRKEVLEEVCADHPGVVYGLRDDSAIMINGDETTFIGSPPLVINPPPESVE